MPRKRRTSKRQRNSSGSTNTSFEHEVTPPETPTTSSTIFQLLVAGSASSSSIDAARSEISSEPNVDTSQMDTLFCQTRSLFKELAARTQFLLEPPLNSSEMVSYPTAIHGPVSLDRFPPDMEVLERDRHSTGQKLRPNSMDFEALMAMSKADIVSLMVENPVTLVKRTTAGLGLPTQAFTVESFLQADINVKPPGGFYVQGTEYDWFYETELHNRSTDTVEKFLRKQAQLKVDVSQEKVACLMNYSPSKANPLWNEFLTKARQLPDVLLPDADDNVFRVDSHIIDGLTLWMGYIKGKGTVTGVHQEPGKIWSINICMSGSSYWLALRNEDACKLEAMARAKFAELYPDVDDEEAYKRFDTSYMPNAEELRAEGLDTYEFVQGAGDMVLLGCGTVHAVRGETDSVHFAINSFPNAEPMWREIMNYEFIYANSPKEMLVRPKELLFEALKHKMFDNKPKSFWNLVTTAVWRVCLQKFNDDLRVAARGWPAADGGASVAWDDIQKLNDQFFCAHCRVEILSPIVFDRLSPVPYCASCARTECTGPTVVHLEREFTTSYLTEKLRFCLDRLQTFKNGPLVTPPTEAQQGCGAAQATPSTSGTTTKPKNRKKKQNQSLPENRRDMDSDDAEESLEVIQRDRATWYRCTICAEQGLDPAYEQPDKRNMKKHVLSCHATKDEVMCGELLNGKLCPYSNTSSRALASHKRSHNKKVKLGP